MNDREIGIAYVLSEHDRERVKARFDDEPATTARRLVGPDADEREWLDARRWRIGASELSAVVPGVHNPHTSAFKLWWAKSLGWELEDTMGLRVGRKLEPVIGDLFGEEHPDLIVCRPYGRLYCHPARNWLACTPDFLAVAPGIGHREDDPTGLMLPPTIEPVECKSDEGGPGWGKPGTGEVPEHHEIQLMAQCAVFGARRGHLVRLAGKRFTSYVVDFDPTSDRWARVMAAGRAFWASLSADDPPDVDDSPSTEDALRLLHPAVEDRTEYVAAELKAAYDDANAQIAEAKASLQAVKNALRAAMGDAKYAAAPGGEPFVNRRVYKNPGSVIPPHEVDGLWPVNR